MTKKVFHSILFVALSVLLASLTVIMGCLYEYFSLVQEQQLEDELSLAAAAVEDSGKGYLEKIETKRYRLTWVSANGTVIYDTLNDATSMENHGDRKEIKDALSNGYGESKRYSSTLLEKTIYSAKRLADGTVLRISIFSETVGVLVFGMLQPILVVLVVALILSFYLARRIATRIVRPLNRLNLDMPLENDTYEELSPLLTRLNYQQKELASQMHKLKRRREEFTQITGNMKESLLLLDANGKVVSINPAACRLFSTDNSCTGKDFLTVDRSPEISHTIESALAEGYSTLRLDRAGRCFQFDVSRIESDGTVAGTVLLAFDVTEQEFAERNRREFTANVSHELKTPLQSIIGSTELIENNMVKEEDMPRFVGHIKKEAARLVALIEDIIRLSQLDEGTELPHEQVELLSLCEEVAVSLNDKAESRKIILQVNGNPISVNGVRRLIYEVLFNLCDNAIKYNVEGGSVDISVMSSEKDAIITVKDTGIGIPLEDQNRIFERFYRVDKSHSKQNGGTGLGLSIVKHAVAYLKGNIELISSVGNGTTVTVTLPVL